MPRPCWRRFGRGCRDGRPAGARIGPHGHRLATRLMLRRALATGGESLRWRWLERTDAAEARRPGLRHQRVDGALQPVHAPVRPRAPAERRAGRGVRLRHPTHPDHPRAAGPRARTRAPPGSREGGGLERRNPDRREPPQLNRHWVRRTIESGAIVLIVSDGWERGDPALLAREMATLRRSCHRLLWLDPLASRPGFEPELPPACVRRCRTRTAWSRAGPWSSLEMLASGWEAPAEAGCRAETGWFDCSQPLLTSDSLFSLRHADLARRLRTSLRPTAARWAAPS